MNKEDNSYNNSKLLDFHKKMTARIGAELFNEACVHVSMLYKPQEFMTGNSLNILKYGEFLDSISESEIDNMADDDKSKLEFSKMFVKDQDLKFFNKLLEAVVLEKGVTS